MNQFIQLRIFSDVALRRFRDQLRLRGGLRAEGRSHRLLRRGLLERHRASLLRLLRYLLPSLSG